MAIIWGAFLFVFLAKKTGEVNQPKITQEEIISEEEKTQIETWIQSNSLNQYGDSKNRVYLGGTPLFNEATGASIDQFEYIIQNNPSRPWKK